MSSSGTMVLRGTLTGHSDWVTCIVVPQDNSDFILTGSRDKSLMKWNITKKEEEFGTPYRRYTGHNGYVEDVALSTDGQYALSGSWDGTLRLWDLQGGKSTRMFSGHKKDVLSVAFSGDNRQIVSGSRDRTLKLWNTLGECKYTISDQGSQNGHADWVSCVRFTPASCPKKLIVSAGWDKQVKVWDLQTCNLVTTLVGHTGVVNTVTISPDGSLCASGGKDGVAMLWELKKGEHLYSLEAGSTIHAMCFAPNRYWLVAATENSIKIWDLEKKAVVDELVPEDDPTAEKKAKSYCVSLAWSSDGTTLYSGYTDGSIRCWQARQ